VLYGLLKRLLNKIKTLRRIIEKIRQFKLFKNPINWLYTKDGNYSIKSGFYLDHFFKRVFSKINKELHFFFGLIFMDSFLLNRLGINFFNN